MRGFIETLRNLKRGKRGIYVCPKCGSPRMQNLSSLGGWIFPNQYLCDECGYNGYLVLELEKEK